MPCAPFNAVDQKKLKEELQNEKRASKLENLAAALLGRLLDVPVAVSHSGFQHGGDAGPAGQQGRRFRLECKKYSDTTSLSERELLGEMDHALARDPALEAWFLVATREVPEQLVQALVQKGEEIGVPVLIIDWAEHEFARLSALCASAPDLVEALFSPEAATLARVLQPAATEAIASLRRQLQSWCLGFVTLRAKSHAKLLAIWNEPRTCGAELGQNAAGGAQQHRVRRQSVHQALGAWWQGPATSDAPAVLFGWDGVGKTWAALDWLVDTKAAQPIILIAPSSATATLSSLSESAVKRFLAERLYELTGVRSSEHWFRRLNHLLTRPKSEGPVLTILLDGMNQEPSVAWLQLLKILQAPAFEGCVRVLSSTRTHHFEDKLSRLRGLVVPAVPITVHPYDASPGDELDQMLAFERLTRDSLHPDLIDLARIPRLFNLVIRFRERLVDAGQVTVHRLLWEYGRDSFGERAGKSFSETEWQEWLREIARQYRDGVQEFSLKALGETARRADLSEREVYARLSDIVDGRFAQRGPSGDMQLSPTVVTHSLGAALLAHLDSRGPATIAAAEAELTRWMDPISGFDQRAEILRATVSIMVERDTTVPRAIAGALVTAWLQTQNITDAYRRELASLATNIPDALLDAIEQSNSRAQASARLWAVNALRSIPRREGPALDAIAHRTRQWLSDISRDLRLDADPKHEQRRKERYRKRIGIDASGPLTVLGVPMQLVDHADVALPALVPALLEDFPLAKAMPCFEAASIALAVRGHLESWPGLKWLCHLNEVDADDMGRALRDLSTTMRNRTPEPGIHPDLPARAAAMLLLLSGSETDDEQAAAINPKLDRPWNYERDYLAQPSRSIFELERRHAYESLHDKDIPLLTRVRRTSEFWLDPSFDPPAEFVTELREHAAAFPAESLHTGSGLTREEHAFEEIEVALARCAPGLLAELRRRTLRSFATRSAQARYWSAIHATDAFVLTGDAEATAAGVLRRSSRDPDESQEWFAAGQLLMVEVRDRDVQAQFDELIQAGLKCISSDFAEVLRVPTAQDVDELIGRWDAGTDRQRHDLVVLLSVHPIAFSETAWSWLVAFTLEPAQELRGLLRDIALFLSMHPIAFGNEAWPSLLALALQHTHQLLGLLFRMLAVSDELQFGRVLAARGWSWDPRYDFWVNHYGTGALMRAEFGLPFDHLAPRLAPWRLLEAVRKRGSDLTEVRLAAEILDHILTAKRFEAPDPGSELSVERSEKGPAPFVLSAEPRCSQQEAANPIAALKAIFDADERIEAHRRATETAIIRIDATRREGASLYLADISPIDVELAVHHAPDIVNRWLEGYELGTADFWRRVRLAEGIYMAVCEVLLKRDPQRGVALWRALRMTLSTRYIGPAGLDDLVHMVFRVPSCSTVEALKEELLTLSVCCSDKALYQVALAASYNGDATWLNTMIEKDRASACAWRRKRAVVLSGFACGNSLSIPEAWPEGEVKTATGRLAVVAAGWRFREASARYWWQAYLTGSNAEAVYAAWVLFLRVADHRARVWMQEEVTTHNDKGALFELKIAHAQLNRSRLDNAMKRRLDKLESTFLGLEIVRGVGPWITTN